MGWSMTLGETLARLMRAERMNPTELGRFGGCGKTEVYHVLKGAPRTRPSTLRKLARGLATDPYEPQVVDEPKAIRYYFQLMKAAGYLTDEEVRAVVRRDPSEREPTS